jgi:Zn-dependent M28 family amino/carboxypeptidase
VAVGLALTMLATAPSALAQSPADTQALRRAVSVDGVMEHQRALQRVADRNGGNRLAGTPGYDQSAAYVARRLRLADYRVTVQPFDFPFFREQEPARLSQVAPATKTYVRDTDFTAMQYSGSGEVTAPVQAVDVQIPPGATANSSTSGCEAADFTGFVRGAVALIQRGTCTFAQKAQNAQAAGAAAVIIFNEGQEGRTDLLDGTLGDPDVAIPVLGTTFELGRELYASSVAGETTVSIFTSTLSETRRTVNVLGETRGGRDDRVVVVGAHLDSVDEGPGINDNGSGTSTILEIAEQMAALAPGGEADDPDAEERGDTFEPRNKVRFAFWGAEEEGLLGSTHYVGELDAEEDARIQLNLNFDMLGSPNWVPFVYDGDASDFEIEGIPPGSDLIERVFRDYFTSRGMTTEPTAFNGRSDYGPFIEAGIPAGGLFSGAEGIKTPAQALLYGGTAGQPYDACYHMACDTIANLSPTALSRLGDGTAHAVLTFAQREARVRPVAPPAAMAAPAPEGPLDAR